METDMKHISEVLDEFYKNLVKRSEEAKKNDNK